MAKKHTNKNAIRIAILDCLKTLGNAERAAQQQAYMKSEMPHAGLQAAELRTACKSIFKDHPLTTTEQWQQTITELWRSAQVREERYAAIELLLLTRYRKQWLTPDELPLIRELVETGAWWDYVDNLASNGIGPLLRDYPEVVKPELTKWSTEPDLWVRRSAILSQLKFHEHTDQDFLFTTLEGSIGDNNFFARKAIGWALRQHSRTAPDAVIKYIKDNRARLSPLTKREGLKLLLKTGQVKDVP